MKISKNIKRVFRAGFEVIGILSSLLFIPLVIWLVLRHLGLTPFEAYENVETFWGGIGTLMAILGTFVTSWFLMRAVVLRDFPFTILGSLCFPSPEESLTASPQTPVDEDRMLEHVATNGKWRIKSMGIYKDKLPAVWDYWRATILLLLCRFKGRHSKIPGVLFWREEREIKGLLSYPPFSWLVSLCDLFHLSAQEVFSPLKTRLSIEDHELYGVAVQRAWDFAEAHPEFIPEGMKRPEKRVEERFIIVLVYDTQKPGFSSLTCLILPEIYALVLMAMLEKDGSGVDLRVHSTYSRGKDNASLIRRAMNALRYSKKEPQRQGKLTVGAILDH